MTRCPRAATFLAWVFLAAPVHAQADLNDSSRNWHLLGTTDDTIVFIDGSSFRRTGNERRVDILRVFRKVEETEAGKADQQLVSLRIDCSTHRYNVEDYFFQLGDKPGPPPIFTKPPEGFDPPPPGTILDLTIRASCDELPVGSERIQNPLEWARANRKL